MKKQVFTICSLIFLLAYSSTAFARDDKESLTAEQIIEKHITAVGGKDALSKIKTRVAEGTVRKDNENAAKVYIMSELPNRVTAFYAFEKFDWVMIYDGNTSHFRPIIPGAGGIFASKYQEIMTSGFMFNSISLYCLLLDSNSQIAYKAKGTKKVNGKEAYIVEAKPKKGDVMKLYFDKETFFWVRTDLGQAKYSKPQGGFTNDVVNRSQDELIVDFYFETSDFREVDGVKLPFKFEQVATAPILKQRTVGTIVGTITEYKHNIPIDPKMFK